MTAVTPTRNLDELARIGAETFDQRVRPTLTSVDHGKYVAFDIVSGEHEIEADDYAAVARLRTRLPTAEVWLAQAGYPTAYRFGRERAKMVAFGVLGGGG